jgi:hypothetical protein
MTLITWRLSSSLKSRSGVLRLAEVFLGTH